ncbi:delta-lactam-biosynthetic de-N-acetylase [Clostridiaceae bacterium 14S0207]|nr:delta-lactam-biosynthetic de-N-acetylase [Clostridiaceae bacterium 14S0207]
MSSLSKKVVSLLIVSSIICISLLAYTSDKKAMNTLNNSHLKKSATCINNSNNLSTKEYNWYFKHVANGKPPLGQPETADFIGKYDTHFLGDVSKKVIYLTFDEGYENGYTAPILDVLKKHNVKAAFFVVQPYIKSNPDLIKRMVNEGHLVCNHSHHHPSMASIHDQNKFNKELSDVEESFESLTGKKMPKYFRPPMGKYSEQSLSYTQQYGYKTIFWSFAYADWDPKKQPSHEYAKKKILDKTHNGAIMLLHAVSKTNSEILDDILTQWKKQGYEIRPLSDI